MFSKVVMGARLFFGLVFLVFGLNGFFNFMPMGEMSPAAGTFFQGVMATKYFMPFLKSTEVICGIMFLTGQWVPLSLVVIAPITLNIFMFHTFVDPKGFPIGLAVVGMNAFLLWSYRNYYRTMFQRTSVPTTNTSMPMTTSRAA